MATNEIDPITALLNLDAQIDNAYSHFSRWIEWSDEWADPAWLTESCFIQLISISESLNLTKLRDMICDEYKNAKGAPDGFNASGKDPDGEPYSIPLGRIRCYQRALQHMFPSDKKTTVTKELLQIIRDIHYTIADTAVFKSPPSDEKSVHLRIEAVLKCVFPDLKHKPTLSKQIKNFEPDTGIPSISTLIEYKFLARKEDIGPIADQLLADTRGYISKDWSRFLYVIYETKRFKRESDWNLFLREAGVPANTTIVVLSGEPVGSGLRAKQPAKHRRKISKPKMAVVITK